MSMLRRLPSSSSRTFSLQSCLHQPQNVQTTLRTSHSRTFGTSSARWNAMATTSTMTKSSTSRRALTIATGIAVLSAAYGLGVLYPPSMYTLIFPREAPPRAVDGSPQAHKEAQKLEKELWTLPLVRELAAKSYPLNADTVPPAFLGPPSIAGVNSGSTRKHDNDELDPDPRLVYYMARPYVNIPESIRRHSLAAGLLQGPGRMAIPPLLFMEVNEKALVGVVHLGRSMCGHDGIVHGGLIATMFDDGLFRTAVANFPARIGVTAWIRLDYKAPTRAEQFVVFRNKVDKVDGRKVFVSGQMEDLEGNVLVKAEALFVQPKYAHLLKSEEREKHFLNRPAAIARTLEPVAETAGTK